MRALLEQLFRLFLRIFFRRVEVAHPDRVPARGPVLLVLNHPNGLIDPLFMLCLAPRRPALLAKAPLFRMPVIGPFARALGAVPVSRRQDPGADPSANREMFARVREHLAGGGAVALFPEGTSHGDPRLRPLKTGAARIALGVRGAEPLRIVPAGLHYTAPSTFRSEALVFFGEPIPVEPAPLDALGEPPEEPVEALTSRITEALAAVTLEAEAHEAHDLVGRTERILRSAAEAGDPDDLAAQFALRRRLLLGYTLLGSRAPARLERLRRRVLRYEARSIGVGLDPWALPAGPHPERDLALRTLLGLMRVLVLLPPGIPGLLLHWPAYRLVAFLAGRFAGTDQALLATVKGLAALLLFPLTWVAAAAVAWLGAGPGAAAAALLLAPASGWLALRLTEEYDRVIGAVRALGLLLLGRRRFHHLVAERRAIRRDLEALAADLGA